MGKTSSIFSSIHDFFDKSHVKEAVNKKNNLDKIDQILFSRPLEIEEIQQINEHLVFLLGNLDLKSKNKIKDSLIQTIAYISKHFNDSKLNELSNYIISLKKIEKSIPKELSHSQQNEVYIHYRKLELFKEGVASILTNFKNTLHELFSTNKAFKAEDSEKLNSLLHQVKNATNQIQALTSLHNQGIRSYSSETFTSIFKVIEKNILAFENYKDEFLKKYCNIQIQHNRKEKARKKNAINSIDQSSINISAVYAQTITRLAEDPNLQKSSQTEDATAFIKGKNYLDGKDSFVPLTQYLNRLYNLSLLKNIVTLTKDFERIESNIQNLKLGHYLKLETLVHNVFTDIELDFTAKLEKIISESKTLHKELSNETGITKFINSKEERLKKIPSTKSFANRRTPAYCAVNNSKNNTIVTKNRRI